MKKIFSLIALTISFCINAQISTDATLNAGEFSSAIGSQTKALGDFTTAAGKGSNATGERSTAIGNWTFAEGPYSTAIGYYTTANGTSATALGDSTIAFGNWSTAMGAYTQAIGEYSTAIGWKSFATGASSTAIGYSTGEEYTPGESNPYYKNEAEGDYSHVFGNRNKSIGMGSISIGSDNLSQGARSLAIGENNISTGAYSMAMGLYSESVGERSFAYGNNAYADGFNTIAIGSANTVDENASADTWSVNNRLLVVGNGKYDEDTETLERSDAFTIMFNGDATLAGNLSVNSDASLKSNITSLGSTIAKVLMLDGKSYSMKNDPENRVNIGLVAQNIEQAFPELVSESNGIKSVNYQGLIPVLINAVEEKESVIKKQEKRLIKLEEAIRKMNE